MGCESHYNLKYGQIAPQEGKCKKRYAYPVIMPFCYILRRTLLHPPEDGEEDICLIPYIPLPVSPSPSKRQHYIQSPPPARRPVFDGSDVRYQAEVEEYEAAKKVCADGEYIKHKW